MKPGSDNHSKDVALLRRHGYSLKDIDEMSHGEVSSAAARLSLKLAKKVASYRPPPAIPGWCDPREPQTERQMACLLGAGMDFDTVQPLTKWEASMCCNQVIQLGRRGEEIVVHRDGPNDTGLIASMFETEMTAKEIIEALRSR